MPDLFLSDLSSLGTTAKERSSKALRGIPRPLPWGLVPAAVRASSTQPIALSLVPQAREYRSRLWQPMANARDKQRNSFDHGRLCNSA